MLPDTLRRAEGVPSERPRVPMPLDPIDWVLTAIRAVGLWIWTLARLPLWAVLYPLQVAIAWGYWLWGWVKWSFTYLGWVNVWTASLLEQLWIRTLEPILIKAMEAARRAQDFVFEVFGRGLNLWRDILGAVFTPTFQLGAWLGAGQEFSLSGIGQARNRVAIAAGAIASSILRAEQRVFVAAEKLFTRVNDLARWVNHALRREGVLREELVLWSLGTFSAAAWIALIDTMIGDGVESRTAAEAQRYPARSRADVVAASRAGYYVLRADIADVVRRYRHRAGAV